ncbi:fungal-specific transcription factor domain-containing protein [Mycena floridula]|nr:fungal-specific transcription factor domain-containing protein [Mycena floridula]
MSAATAPDGPSTKKRRLRGACDSCKSRKIRCDSAKMPGGVCSSCLELDIDCRKEIKSKTKPVPLAAPAGLAEHSPVADIALEFFQRHRAIRSTVAAILSPIKPYEVPKEFPAIRLIMVELAVYIDDLEKALESACSISSSSSPTISVRPNDALLDDHALLDDYALSERLKRMSLQKSHTRFYGRSSDLMLLKSVVNIRKEFSGQQELSGYPMRNQYWAIPPWEIVPEPTPIPLTFPEPDLLRDLIDLYFLHFNPYNPLLHKPTFDRLVNGDMHLVDHQFGMTVLGVIAIGARYSYDSRVLEDEVDAGNTELGVGWKYHRQITLTRSSFVKPTTLYELQLYCLAILYELGSSTPETCWMHLGIAVRFLQDIGLHRKAPNAGPPTVETELWKRVFWVIMCIDIILSATIGRPRAINVDDYDQDLPADCDDEYWEHPDPARAFKQPAGTPSKMNSFLRCIELLDILAFAQRTIYGVKKPPSPLDPSVKWDIKDVMKIDSALNAWVDSLPSYLKWDPHREDTVLFNQSCLLYVMYYHIQIVVHKPFIPSPGSLPMANMSFPSLAICANAARSCCHVMDVQSRKSFLPMAQVMIPLSNSVFILLLNHWSGRRLGLSSNPGKEYADVYKCLNVLRLYEKRWQIAGRFCDVIEQLLNLGPEKSLPTTSTRSLKRSRDSEDEPQVPQTSTAAAQELYNLPFSTNELGRLPVYGSFNFTDSDLVHSEPILFEDPELVQIIESMDPSNETYGLDMTFVPMFPQGEEYSWGNWATNWPHV